MKKSLDKYQNVNRNFLHWILNVFLKMTIKFIRRDKKLWLFGAWEGQKYSDNAKYLFEYIHNNHKDINCVWITKNVEVYKELKKLNLPCAVVGTQECRKIELKAGVCFYTNGIDDFGNNPLIFGAKIVSLGHGVSFKKLGFERPNRNNKVIILKILKELKYSGYFQCYADYFITSSQYMKNRICKQFFKVNPENVFITGQPRNDIFNLNEDNNFERIIFYMPTYRNNPKSAKKLEKILMELSGDIFLKEVLAKYNMKFYVKLHYLTPKIHLREESNIKILSDRECKDVQEMILKAKLLITDYSSVINDFALLKRPVILFPFDKDVYLKEEGLSDDYEKILIKETTAYDVKNLGKILNAILSNEEIANNTIEKINSYFNDSTLVLGNFSENVFNAIYKEINNEK